MPHGYKCDRCKEFTENDHRERHAGLEGPVENVQVGKSDEDGDLMDVKNYTLCPRCRRELTAWVEGYSEE